MLTHRALGLASLSLILASVACVATGCAADNGSSSTDDTSDAPSDPGDGTTDENNIVSERQIDGSELPQKTVALSFDDGPGRRTTELAEYLEGEGIKATFFINGKNVPGRQGALDSVVSRGHILANHTQNHLQLTNLSAAKIVSEVEQTDAFIQEVQPNGPWLLRAPFGAWNGNVARTVNGTAMKKYTGSIFWNAGGQLTSTAAADWDCWGKGVSIQRCGELYLQEIRARKRGIVLMHDIHDKTIDMVKTVIVPTLKAEGWSFAAMTDVPAVARSIGQISAGAAAGADQCQSATLGRPVAENVCVQSRSTQKWSRCVNGDWTPSTGPSDGACTQRFPL